MKIRALLLLALIFPLIYAANMISKKWATSEANEAEMRRKSAGRTNIDIDLSTQPSTMPNDADADAGAPATPKNILGVVVPALVVDVRSQVNGIIDNVPKTIGDSVDAAQPLATLDSADIALEIQTQAAKVAAAGHRVNAAEIDLKILEEQQAHMLEAQKQQAASQYEVSQIRRQVEAASARLKAALDEAKEQQIASRSIEQRMHKYRCLAPIAGKIVEIDAVTGGYVREGQLLAKVQSNQQQVNISLSSELIEQLQNISLRLPAKSGSIALKAVEVMPNCNLDGTRCVRLAVPAGTDLIVGQTLRLEVSSKL